MPEFKFTGDGRKVLVVGKLNAEETIVQEVFVTEGGQEIPSGKNFVVESLHERPVKSWKESQLEKLESRYESESREWEKKLEKMNASMRLQVKKAELKASAITDFVNNAKEEQLDTLRLFLAGEIQYFFVSIPAIVTWDEVYCSEGCRVDSIKLVSLFGRSRGNLSYKIHGYSDGSGVAREVVPFADYQGALMYAQNRLNEAAKLFVDGASRSLRIDVWEKIEGIVIPEEARKKWNENKRANWEERLERAKINLAKIEQEEDEL